MNKIETFEELIEACEKLYDTKFIVTKDDSGKNHVVIHRSHGIEISCECDGIGGWLDIGNTWINLGAISFQKIYNVIKAIKECEATDDK